MPYKILHKYWLNTFWWVHKKKDTYALSFYGSKMILDHPNHFGQVSLVLDGPNLFWLGPYHFGHIQIMKIGPEKSNLNLIKMI